MPNQRSRVGNYEIVNEEIGHTHHEGRDGWTFSASWKPGDGHEKLVSVLNNILHEGKQLRTKEISMLLGISNK